MTKLPQMLNASYRHKNNRFNRAGQVFTQSIEIQTGSCICLAIAQLRDILTSLISVGGLMETLYTNSVFSWPPFSHLPNLFSPTGLV